MKTATKIGLATLAGIGFFSVAPAFAQDLTSAGVVLAANAAPPSAAAMPKIEAPKAAEPAAMTDHVSSPPNLDPGKGKAGKDETVPGKVPDSVKSVIKRLNTATENVTLEDLNSAREAVAKLDILIDIEKRLNDLSKLRSERDEQSLANVIPASALGQRGVPVQPTAPLPAYQPFPGADMGAQSMISPPVVSTSGLEVQRISGAGGRYSALVKSGEGKPLFVREGDKLPDGSVVQDITSHGLTLLKGSNKRTVQVKDVAVVFNGR